MAERRALLALGWFAAAVGGLTSGLGLALSTAPDLVEVLSVRGNAVLLYGDGSTGTTASSSGRATAAPISSRSPSVCR